MKWYRVLLLVIFLLEGDFSLKGASSFSCPNPETIERLADLQQCVSTIKSKVCDIQEIVINIIDDEGSCVAEISQVGEILCSKIENITVIAEVSGLEELISASDVFLCSKIDEVEELISASDVLLCSKIENITVIAETSGVEELISASDVLLCSKLEEIEDSISETDVLICSKIGDFADDGSCLETLIDVPQDINDLDLNVIQLLKTILLELRGCNQC